MGVIAIEAVAYELAPHRISSSALEERIAATLERLGLPRGQFEQLTGIRERRFWDAETTPSEVATRAARKVIMEADIDPGDIGCLINTSVCKDYIEPSVACLVHGNLNLSPQCLNYDIANACLGFLNAIDSVGMMIEKGLIKYGLVVDGESSREVVESTLLRLRSPDTTLEDFRDQFATLTLGSGAVAMLLCHRDHARSGHIINGSVSRAATRYNRLCYGQKDYMKTDSTALLLAGVELAGATWKQAIGILPRWDNTTIDHYIPHQVSTRNMEALCKALKLDFDKAFLNVQTQGNIGPAALPITLGMALDAGRLKPGDHVALMGIGSGLNCTMMSLTW